MKFLPDVDRAAEMTLPDTPSTNDSSWLTAAEPADETITMPQTLAGVFDEAFDLYKRHFGLLAMIVAVGLIPTEILRNTVVALWLHPLDAHLSGADNASPESLILLRFGQFLFGEPRSGFAGLLALMMLVLLSAPISIAVSDIYFGKTTTVRDCYRRSRPYLMNMIGGYGLITLVIIGVAFAGATVVSIPAAIIAGLLASAGIPEIGIVLFLVFMTLPYCFCAGIFARNFMFMTPLTILEGLPASFVSFRNFQLVGKKRFWRTFSAAAALPILWFGFQSILNASIRGALENLHLPSVANFAAVSAVGTAVHFFLAPYWVIFVTLLYYDYRVRREGFDVRVLSLTKQETDTGAES